MVARFPNVVKLNLSRCKEFASFESLPESCNAAKMKELNLSGCGEMSDDALHYLASWMPALEDIDLSASFITDDGTEVLSSQFRQLSRLSMNNCTEVSEQGLSNLVDRCKSLTSLSLQGTNVTADSVSFARGSKLASLNLSKCKRLGHYSIVKEAKHCQLTDLNLSSNPGLQSVSLDVATLVQLNLSSCGSLKSVRLAAPALRLLNLSGCKLLSDLKIEGGTKLETVNLFGCRSLQEAGFNRLVRSALTTLDTMICSGMINLSAESISLLLDPKCASLKAISLDGCKALPGRVVDSVKAYLTQLATEREKLVRDNQAQKKPALPVINIALPSAVSFGVRSETEHKIEAETLDEDE
jgi:hypothetical protein